MKNAIGSLLVICIMASCSNNRKVEFSNERGLTVSEVWYSNGNLKSRVEYLNENRTDYNSQIFFEDGSLMDSASYKDNMLSGRRVHYDKQSGLKHVENYRNGILEGMNHATYDNGINSFTGFWRENRKSGEWIFRYPDGKPITYEFYDSAGQLLYFRKYDEIGNYQSSSGSVLISADLSKQLTHEENTFRVNLVACLPPGCETTAIATIKSPQNIVDTVYHQVLSHARSYFEVGPGNGNSTTLEVEIVVTDCTTGRTETGVSSIILKY